MPAAPPRRRARQAAPNIPLSMVRAAAYSPSPPLDAPVGQNAVALSCSDPMMPTGISRIQIISLVDEPEVLPIISAELLDPLTIVLYFPDTYGPVGVYVPYNDPGFRGIHGGMLNPGELAIRDVSPGPFPWVCSIG